MSKNLLKIIVASTILLNTSCSNKLEQNIGTKEKPLTLEFVKIPKTEKTDGFYIQTTETTVEQFTKYLDEEKKQKDLRYRIVNNWETKPSYPVRRITFKQAEEYCTWLSKKLGKNVSLPTSEQYEAAAFDGMGEQDLATFLATQQGNMRKESRGIFLPENVDAKKVKSFQPNERGVYDLFGNVWEMGYIDNQTKKKAAFGKSYCETTNNPAYTDSLSRSDEESSNVGFRPIINP